MIERQNLFPDALSKRVVGGHVLYSPVVTVVGGKLVFVSGLLARNQAGEIVGKGDMGAQIRQVGENLKAALAAAGATLADLVRTQTFTTDEVRRLSHPDFLVEVEAIAVTEIA
jgi:2-iminobutanoate/2-iminopropanoate deaminase